MKYIKLFVSVALTSVIATSCIREEIPNSTVSDKQVAAMSDTQLSMLYGISSYMVAVNSWGSSGYYLNDWGYPCQMYYREVNGEDFPVYKSTYDYWTYHENGTYASSYTVYTWYYYYKLIKNCNNLIGAIDENTTNEESKRYLGSALAFRAMAYLDLARSFEFKPTGYASIDSKAEDDGIWGLTVPIVTEKTTNAETINNPRVDFCTMYRFIMTDLEKAQKLLDGYNPSDVSLPGNDCVNGLMARVWMEVGSRLEENSEYIKDYTTKLAESNKKNDGYTTLNVTSAKDCYEKAIVCADNAMQGHTPITESQWHDAKTGFNTANQAWLWRCRIGGKEQEPVYYCSFLGQIASEPQSGLAYAYDAYRCIGSYLYKKIESSDWRKNTWINPNDAGKSTTNILNKYQTNLDASSFAKLPAYANLKFRPGSGNIDEISTWLIGDLPIMRMEEMVFIKAEALARSKGYDAGLEELTNFIQVYRFDQDGDSYEPECESLQDFIEELLIQKRIEFWGEGICYFDYKRLNLRVDRSNSTNVEDAFKLVSNKNYCCPWMNYFIPTLETQRNEACKANPDVSGDYTK